MASITSSASDQRLSTSKRHLKPLKTLRDYLLDDLSSCSSNGFKSFPRRQPPPSSSSSTIRRLLDAEIKRSGLIHHHHHKQPHRTGTSRRITCATAINKASTVFLKLLPFLNGVFSKSISKRLLSRRREVKGDGKGEIQWWKSFAYEESLHQPSDLVFQISITTVKEETTVPISEAVITSVEEFVPGDSSSSNSEFFTEVVQSSSSSSSSSTFSSSLSGESEEVSNKNDIVEEGNERGERLKSRDSDGSSVNRSDSKECVNEEKEQLSPVSILECPFKDDQEEDDDENNKITDQNVARKSKRLNGLVKLKPLDLEKRLENYVEKQEEDESLNRANRLFALIKTRIGETNNLLASHVVDNLLLDYFQEDNIGPKEEILMVKKVEDWVMGRQEEMFMSWEVREKRGVYVKEMKWGCICGDERQSVVEDLANGLFTLLVDELISDLALG